MHFKYEIETKSTKQKGMKFTEIYFNFGQESSMKFQKNLSKISIFFQNATDSGTETFSKIGVLKYLLTSKFSILAQNDERN